MVAYNGHIGFAYVYLQFSSLLVKVSNGVGVLVFAPGNGHVGPLGKVIAIALFKVDYHVYAVAVGGNAIKQNKAVVKGQGLAIGAVYLQATVLVLFVLQGLGVIAQLAAAVVTGKIPLYLVGLAVGNVCGQSVWQQKAKGCH